MSPRHRLALRKTIRATDLDGQPFISLGTEDRARFQALLAHLDARGASFWPELLQAIIDRIPPPEGDPDAPLQALMLSATKLMGAYGQESVRAAGLKLSLAGLGVLRILISENGLKASEVADRAWSSPGTLTSVVNTLVRDGFVERKPDETDRRVVRLYITDQGRTVITYYVSQAAAWWRKAFDFVDSDDEAVVRRFFIQMINHLSQLMREERGA